MAPAKHLLLPEAPDIPSDEPALLRFGTLEGRILHALWAFDELTQADLQLMLAEFGVHAAVLRAALEKMNFKRLVRVRTVHRIRYYRATVDRSTFIALLRGQLLDFLGDDGMALLRQA
jgi:predicted transcriptional regulator